MLFHVTMRHDNANCAGLHDELMPKVVEGLGRLHETAAEYGVTVKGHYNALPNHVEFLVADAPGPAALAMCLSDILSYEVDFETYAVVESAELLEAARQMLDG